MTLNDLELRNNRYFAFFSPNSTALQADYVTVVVDRLIMFVKYCLPVPVFQFWPKLTHHAARSLFDSWASCLITSRNRNFQTIYRFYVTWILKHISLANLSHHIIIIVIVVVVIVIIIIFITTFKIFAKFEILTFLISCRIARHSCHALRYPRDLVVCNTGSLWRVPSNYAVWRTSVTPRWLTRLFLRATLIDIVSGD